MFMKTIAVGPLDEVASCVTGGTTVAMDRFDVAVYLVAIRAAGDRVACLQTCDTGIFSAISKYDISLNSW